ncbi:ankyrin repeat domain-containing protein, partial [archaeon]
MTIIQAAVRRWLAQRQYNEMKRAAIAAAACWRRVCASRERQKRWHALLAVQSYVRRFLTMQRAAKYRRAIAMVQRWYMRARAAIEFRRRYAAAHRIERAAHAHMRRRVLETWVQEVHAAAAWGDVDELRALFTCADSRFATLRDIPASSLVLIRSRYDGLKSVLHSAAASGNADAVAWLLSLGADVRATDSLGATPLHKAASIGDSHLDVAKALILAAPAQTGLSSSAYASLSNAAGETALDVAVVAFKQSGRNDHEETIRYLLS